MTRLAMLGGNAAFKEVLPVGQLYFPSWNEYEVAFRGIFQRRYYTNHGPLVESFEKKLIQFLDVKHAICVSNATIGLCILIEAMGVKGKVIVPAFTFISTIQSLLWCGIEPILCDIALDSHHLDINKLEFLLEKGADAVLAVNLWGGCADIHEIEQLCNKYGIPVLFDSAQAFGSMYKNKKIGGFGKAEVFSFHATKIVSATEGGVITTNDDDLAERLRNVRSSYGVRQPINVSKTANGRMSEAQAAIGLISLTKFDAYKKRNEMLFLEYKENLKDIPGVKIIKPENVMASNYQYLVCELDEESFGLNRDSLIKVLQAENIMARKYFNPLCYKVYNFEGLDEDFLRLTEMLSDKIIQLPLGALTEKEDVFLVCSILRDIHNNCDRILNFIKERAE